MTQMSNSNSNDIVVMNEEESVMNVMNEAARLIQNWWTKDLPLMKLNEYYECPCRHERDLCASHRKQLDARKYCQCGHQPLCSRCEIYYCDDEVITGNRWDGCRYDCVKCKRNYKNKYFGRNTSLCYDCEWAEHERRKGE